MLATSGKLPPDDDRWLYEVKYDGWRALLYVEAGRVRIMSRRGLDLTDRCPELQPLAPKRRRIVLDAELVVLDDSGRPDFFELSRRMKSGSTLPVIAMLFDLLHLDGK